ncbi:DUF4260 family protein [Cytobacillus purgationiresistens]|uniref:DUF4260 family protein n=1 Tax=Cytobacillus purgationiresistens TaxID=863449 RepID=UPI0027D872D4|nr:DUF4260 family protein [Cytobacillus purgationiresistens]
MAFAVLLLSPDLSALGYLQNVKVGSVFYNLFHTYTIPAVIILCGFLMENSFPLMIGLIWIAHIGMDRMFGFGSSLILWITSIIIWLIGRKKLKLANNAR